MLYWKVFALAFMATLGFEVALGLCLTLSSIFKGGSKK